MLLSCQFFWLTLVWLATMHRAWAANLTAKVDYGFGPLWISYDDVDDSTISRCSNITFSFGGGFGPYKFGEAGSLASSGRAVW